MIEFCKVFGFQKQFMLYISNGYKQKKNYWSILHKLSLKGKQNKTTHDQQTFDKDLIFFALSTFTLESVSFPSICYTICKN